MHQTERLILRGWQDSDIQPFFELNQDAKVMEFFPTCPSYHDTVNMVQRFKSKLKAQGFGFYACELKATQRFIGFVGLIMAGNGCCC